MFYIINAVGQKIIFGRNRAKAQEKCDKEYGKGKYRVSRGY